MDEIILQIDNIEKNFGAVKVLNNISLAIRRGEFITLLGSSGCGKTTTLRIIAGLEAPDSGRVILEGIDVTNVEPNKRNVNTVFQSYALFPHMTVEENIGYSLKLKRTPKKEANERISEALELVRLSGYGRRMPSELSGGQRQRVAIARAAINRPKVLLLDEPLGALDLQLRRQMQMELKGLQKSIGITFIYITHDQEEALNMSDRIVVMRNGSFEQIGTPETIYDYPQTSYVAQFVGAANIIQGTVQEVSKGLVRFKNSNGYGVSSCPQGHFSVGQTVTVAVRRENIKLNRNDSGFPALITEKSFVGGVLQITATLKDGSTIIASRHGLDSSLSEGDKVFVWWEPEKAVFVDLEAHR